MNAEMEDKLVGLLKRHPERAAGLATLVEVGSTAHGISLGDGEFGDDLDLVGVYFESMPALVRGNDRDRSVMVRTADKGVRSEPGDIDLTLHSYRRFVHLCMKGNPTVLAALHAKPIAEAGRLCPCHREINFDQLARMVASKRAADAFLGYMHQQILKGKGEKNPKVQRPELVAAHGYDTKFAAHALRLGVQGLEYVTYGKMLMPLVDKPRDFILAVRRGEIPAEEAWAKAEELKAAIEAARKHSPLPDHPEEQEVWEDVGQDYARVLRYWDWSWAS